MRATRAPRLLLPLLLFAACSSPEAQVRTDGPSAPGEQSVNPGINDRFLSGEMSAEEATRTFEGESREIYAQREQIAAAVGIEPGMAVADIGAGTGLFLPYFTEAAGMEGWVYAVDIAPQFIAHMERRIAEAGWLNATTVLCGERSTGLPAESVDVAFVCDTYHHFEYPGSTLASLFEALQPGGRLVVVDFERIPGVSRDWVLGHVRAGKDVFRAEIEAAGFVFEDEVPIAGLEENYLLRFRKPR